MIFKGLKLRVLLLLMGILFSALFFQYMVIDSDVMIENFRGGIFKKAKSVEPRSSVTVEETAVKDSLRKILTNCID